MNFKAAITVMPNADVKNNIGKTVIKELKKQHIKNIIDVKVGKHYILELEANSKNAAAAFVEEACKSLLVEQNEDFDYKVEEI